MDRLEDAELARFAAGLAHEAGCQLREALQAPIVVRFKQPGGTGRGAADPVSDVDLRLEGEIRAAIRARYPEHGIVGEELEPTITDDDGYVWAVDPIDGTTNFVHRFPLVAVSVACLFAGRPVAGAVWCSASHEQRAGVYHAALGGPLEFEGMPLRNPERVPLEGRGLVATPAGDQDLRRAFDVRTTGSAAVDCAFVAAGILRGARLPTLNIWDVAGGLVLLHAAGGRALEWVDGDWRTFERFDPPFAGWRRQLLIGDADDLVALRDAVHEGRQARAREP